MKHELTCINSALVMKHPNAPISIVFSSVLGTNSKVWVAEGLQEWPLWEKVRCCPMSDVATSPTDSLLATSVKKQRAENDKATRVQRSCTENNRGKKKTREDQGQESWRCPKLSLFLNTQVSNEMFVLIGNKLNICFLQRVYNQAAN